jgi:S-adenosylmethionine:tRNA ribosyltransferase-isomerase
VTAAAVEQPERLEAHEPPEARGVPRDGVRLLVSHRAAGTVEHATFRDLPSYLEPGDLLVVNTSATLPAAVTVTRADGMRLELRFSTSLPGGSPDGPWLVELREGDDPFAGVQAGDTFALPAGGTARILTPYAAPRLWLAELDLPDPLEAYLAEHGSPIRYGYVPRRWPLSTYQNVYADEPGSAEMASAGRPFTPELITRLVAQGVLVAPLTLHTGVSSQERHEAPYPERFRVPEQTARLVNAVHDWGRRVVAVGTTVVRALETVSQPDGTVEPGDGWTHLVVTPERGLWTVDGLLSGLHEPESSHFDLLRGAVGEELLDRSYAAALEHGYRWHEFGDSHLVLP